MSFTSIIAPALAAFAEHKKLTDLKADMRIKTLSPFITGGISKMTKGDLSSLAAALGAFSADPAESLDESQRAVVTAPHNAHIRIIAGAGSGKTTTIVSRIKWLMSRALPSQICVLTFNVDSRKNLVAKLAELFGFNVNFPVFTIDKYALDHITVDRKPGGISVKEYCYHAANLPAEILDNMSREYKYVFFDEFQDVDHNQFQLLKNMARGAWVSVVGDDCQNIYQFRGTDNYFIVNFDKLVPKVSTYKLLNNYRSAVDIVAAANTTIEHNSDRIDKQLVAVRPNSGEVSVEFPGNAAETTKYVCEQIHALVNSGIPAEQIAVLSRGRRPLKDIETELTRMRLQVDPRLDDVNNSTGVGVTLSTIHRAKGLEWDTVFVVGMHDKFFPSHLNGGIANINEERRLFYVAITRAKNTLVFCVSREIDRESRKPLAISRFLHEIAPHLAGWDRAPPELLCHNDRGIKQTAFSVTSAIEKLQGVHISQMRDLGLLPPLVPVKTVFAEKCAYTAEITTNNLEADYGIFCDTYITRRTQAGTNTDPAAEAVLADSKNGTCYSATFIKLLESAYADYRTNSNTDERNIYIVSLCTRICDGRRRLMYRNVHTIFAAQTEILRENYRKFLSADIVGENPRHKSRYQHHDRDLSITGITDFISDDTLVEIKCSSSELETEWIIQLLLYRALIEASGKRPPRNIAVVNVLRGEYTVMPVPVYDSVALVSYMTDFLAEYKEGTRSQVRPDLDLDCRNYVPDAEEDTAAATVEWEQVDLAHDFVAIDVENNTTTGAISEIGLYYSGKSERHIISGAVIDWRQSTICAQGTGCAQGTNCTFRAAIGRVMDVLAATRRVIGHNLRTDMQKILNNITKSAPEYGPAWVKMLRATELTDTLSLARQKLKMQSNTLPAVYEHLTARPLPDAHNAAVDAAATAEVYELLRKIAD